MEQPRRIEISGNAGLCASPQSFMQASDTTVHSILAGNSPPDFQLH
jgi:hypothetical protein